MLPSTTNENNASWFGLFRATHEMNVGHLQASSLHCRSNGLDSPLTFPHVSPTYDGCHEMLT